MKTAPVDAPRYAIGITIEYRAANYRFKKGNYWAKTLFRENNEANGVCSSGRGNGTNLIKRPPGAFLFRRHQ